MSNLIVGNAISLVAAVFLVLSALSQRVKTMHCFQLAESVFILLSQLAFGYLGGAVTMLIAIVRGALVIFRKYTLGAMLITVYLTFFMGLKFNTGGVVGVIPVFASTFYAIAVRYARKAWSYKLCLILNLALWAIYAALINDFVTCAVNFISLILGAYSLIVSFYKKRFGRINKT